MSTAHRNKSKENMTTDTTVSDVLLNDVPILTGNSNVISSINSKRFASNPYPSISRPHRSVPTLSTSSQSETASGELGRSRAPRSMSANLPAPVSLLQTRNPSGSAISDSRFVPSSTGRSARQSASSPAMGRTEGTMPLSSAPTTDSPGNEKSESTKPQEKMKTKPYQFPTSDLSIQQTQSAQSLNVATLSPTTQVSSRSRNTSGQHVVYPNPMLSVFWKANDPSEWTMDRVIYWLEYNKFGPDWIETFRSKNLQGEEFLSLVSYQKLKSLGSLSATNDIYDTKPSRFIHILRKVLDRSNSSISNNAIGVADQVEESGEYRLDHKPHIHSPDTDLFNIDENTNTLRASDVYTNTNVVSTKSSENLTELDASKLKMRSSQNRSREHAMQSYASEAAKVQNPPSSPTSFSHIFSKRNTKSTSSESSVNALPPSAKANQIDEKAANSEDFKKPSGLLGKLRRKDRNNSKDRLYQSRSGSNIFEIPLSPVATVGHETLLPVQKPSQHQLLTLDSKFRPVRLSEPSKCVVVTANNENFSIVNIIEASTIEEVKIMIGNRLNIQDWSLCSFHLTDFGLKEGQALDDATFHSLIFNPAKLGMENEPLKIFVAYIPDYDPSMLPGSLSLEYVFAANTRQSNSIPLDHPESGIHHPPPLPPKPDQGASKNMEHFPESLPPLQNPQWQHFRIPGYQSKVSRKASKTFHDSKPSVSEEKDLGPLPVNSKASLGSLFEYNNYSRRTSEDSFKVIRPERREINFDDRRSSPYDRRPSYNPRQNSIFIQTGTLTPNAAASMQRMQSSQAQVKSNSQSVEQSTPQQGSVTPPTQFIGPKRSSRQSTKPERNISQVSRKSSKLERTPSQLVALRSAPPPPPGTSLLRTGSSATDRSSALSGDANHPESIVRREGSARRRPVRSESTKRVTSGPPRIDLGDLESPGLSEELGFGFDEIQGGNTVSRPLRSSLRKSKIEQDEKFHENEISFEGAPAFEDSGTDSSSSDEGLWAKKPPITNQSPLKPQLHIATLSSGSNDYTIQSPDPSIQKKSSGSYLSDIKVGGWAVRPPADVVYENLERFFPGADLDKPILFDPQGVSPPSSPGNDQIISSSRYPLSPVVEPPRTDRYPKGSSESLGSYYQGPSPSSAVSQSNQLSDASSSAHNVSVSKSHKHGSRSVGGISDSTGDLSSSYSVKTGGISMRPKSLRIVVQEATERRKRFQALANEGGSKSGALVRRKSTKMWGQRVVEVKPNDMKRGQLSKLRDNRGKEKQFVWVKGELIGKGSFGKVYLALNATAGEMIAVKQVEVPQTVSDKSSARLKEIIDTLHSEVETMKDLDHFNIVQYLGFEALPDFYNLFLEYVPGGSVGSALRKHGRFEEAVIKSLTRQVLDALSYLHSCGILHRDLKSDNLLIDLDGVCKISDFGISKKSRNIYANDAEMSMQGTIFWMAPEVIHNVIANAKQGYSAKVDIWSLGCVVLEMFAGRRPWSTDEAIGAMYKLGNARLAPPIPEDTIPFVSEDGKDVIDKCFTIDPEQRPTASELFVHPFCNIPRNFRFQDTQLAQMIRVNDKRIGKDSGVSQ